MEYEAKENALEEAFESKYEEESEHEKGQPLDKSKLPYTREHDRIVSRTRGCEHEVMFGPQPDNLVPANPFASKAQQRFLYANPEKVGGKAKLKEWSDATDFKHLPEKKKK